MSPLLSLGFLELFGRSPTLRAFDAECRALDLHPKLVPEAVKLTALGMMIKESGRDLSTSQIRAAAELLVYCMTGVEGFAAANGHIKTKAMEARIEDALAEGTNMDAKLVLLALHADVIQPSVVERFGLVVDPG